MLGTNRCVQAGRGGSNLKPILSKWYTSGASYGNSFIIYESDNNIRWVSDYGSNTSPTFSYEHNWPTGEWHHIAAYYGDSLKLFIDGSCVSEGINVSNYDNSNSNFRIGRLVYHPQLRLLHAGWWHSSGGHLEPKPERH